MAASLIETMAADFEPEKYEDDYQNQLKELIEAKAAGGEAFTVEEREEASDDDGDDEVADLLAALRASVKDRGGDADSSDDEDADDQKRLPPPAVGYPSGGIGFDLGDVDVESRALDLGAPAIECADERVEAAGVASVVDRAEDSRGWDIRMRPVSPFSPRCRALTGRPSLPPPPLLLRRPARESRARGGALRWRRTGSQSPNQQKKWRDNKRQPVATGSASHGDETT